MKQVRFLVLALLVCFSVTLAAAPIQFTAAQQEAVNKITAKGGLVLQLANDSDALVVNLSLAGKQTTDAELAQVKNLPKVAQLNLANTAVTDAGLASIAGLSDLTMLHLEKTGVTDAGLAHLKGLAKLEYLNLYSTGVTDKGLASLEGLKDLKKLYLWQTKVSDAGVSSLKKAVPGVAVNRGEELAIVVKAPEPIASEKPTAAATGGALNSKCPVSGKPVEGANTVTYEGKLVAFCCDKCPKAFQKEPTKYASKIEFDLKPAPAPEKKPAEKKAGDAKPAEKKSDEKKPEEKKVEDKKADAGSPVNANCPVSGKPIETSFTALYDSKTVGFCCDKCLAKFNADPKKFADKIVADAAK
jgi:YHS domain-containing protein